MCLEGPDKSGKTTQSLILVKTLRRKGLDAVYTTEPSTGEVGKFIRQHILRKRQRVNIAVEALLFAADRIDHVENEIKPLLTNNKLVISDRYVYSSLAYQGAAGLDISWIREVNRLILKPDLVIYLDVPLDVVLQRCRGERSVMENEEIQERVKEVYENLLNEENIIQIDGNRPKSIVAKDIETIVMKELQLKRVQISNIKTA